MRFPHRCSEGVEIDALLSGDFGHGLARDQFGFKVGDSDPERRGRCLMHLGLLPGAVAGHPARPIPAAHGSGMHGIN